MHTELTMGSSMNLPKMIFETLVSNFILWIDYDRFVITKLKEIQVLQINWQTFLPFRREVIFVSII